MPCPVGAKVALIGPKSWTQHASAQSTYLRLSVRMSASLLNAATMPGAQPGASVGIAAQAAQAAQANGPMAGFEALLAAFFGDQGLTAPTVAGPILPGQAQPGATPAAGKVN